MKTYNYYYNNEPITKAQLLEAVPENRESEVDETGQYSWGHYRAIEVDYKDSNDGEAN